MIVKQTGIKLYTMQGNMEDLQQMVMDDNLDGLKRMLETGRDLSCVDDVSG